MHAERANAEQKRKAQGYTIDTGYRDPDETSGDQPISPPAKTGAK
ncbi:MULTISPECIES: hypothetical protein [Ralstonia]|mgnify:CR=1 FL=1|jgi:hypothetical protein|nr:MULTISPECIES: hypothetical protein [Ralstonia]MDR9387243.1 hypothetical protein [Ralstonia sp. 11b]MEA3269472.1 hypothetical protein [Pseudomonadota bacterium]